MTQSPGFWSGCSLERSAPSIGKQACAVRLSSGQARLRLEGQSRASRLAKTAVSCRQGFQAFQEAGKQPASRGHKRGRMEVDPVAELSRRVSSRLTSQPETCVTHTRASATFASPANDSLLLTTAARATRSRAVLLPMPSSVTRHENAAGQGQKQEQRAEAPTSSKRARKEVAQVPAKKQKTGLDTAVKAFKQSSASKPEKQQPPTAATGKPVLMGSRAASAAQPTATKQKQQPAAAGKERLVRDKAAAAATQASSAKQHQPRRPAAQQLEQDLSDAHSTLRGKRRQQTAKSSPPSAAGTATQAKLSRLSVQGLPSKQLSARTAGKANVMSAAKPGSKAAARAGTTSVPVKSISKAARPSSASKAGPSGPVKQPAAAEMLAATAKPAAKAAKSVDGNRLKPAAEGKIVTKAAEKNASLPAKVASSLPAAKIKASLRDKAATAAGQATAVALDSRLGCSKCRFATSGCGRCRAKQAGQLRAAKKSRGELAYSGCAQDCESKHDHHVFPLIGNVLQQLEVRACICNHRQSPRLQSVTPHYAMTDIEFASCRGMKPRCWTVAAILCMFS